MDLSKYYAEIIKEPLLSKTEERKLIVMYKATKTPDKERTKARDQILKANLRFVFKQAKYFSKNDPEMFKDLISAGNEGLMVGLEKFKLASKVRFLSYAGWWIRQRILKEMSRLRIVSLPIYKQQLATRILKAKNSNPKITIKQLKKLFPEASEKDIKELSGTRYLTYYLDDLQEDSQELDPVSANMDAILDNKKVFNVVKSLPSPHREILCMTYGLDDGREHTMAQISKHLLLTRDQLKQFKKEAHDMMKDKLVAEDHF